MKTKLFFIWMSCLIATTTDAQNPFQEIGKGDEITMLTASNGKYTEYFENDTLRQIGSVIFNTVTRKVQYFIPQDNVTQQQIAIRSKETSRFLSPDPQKNEFPFQSPYIFSSNNPIKFIDYDGGFTVDPTFREKYPKVTLILENADKLYNNQELPADVKEALKGVDIQKVFNENFRPALEEYSTLTDNQIQEIVAPNSGPMIQSKSLTRLARPGEQNVAIDGTKEVNGTNETIRDEEGYPTNKNITEQGVITLDKNMVAKLEQQLGGDADYNGVGGTGTSVKGKNAAFLGVISTLFHEVVHFGRNKTGAGNKGSEKGVEWENKVYNKNIDPPTSKELEQNE